MESIKVLLIMCIVSFFGTLTFGKTVEVIEGTLVESLHSSDTITYLSVEGAPDDQLSFYIETGSKQVPLYFNAKKESWTLECNKPIKFYGSYKEGVFLCNGYYSECERPIQMATGMRSNGKIYVVIGVICILFIGLFGFMVSTNMSVNKLEKEAKDLK